MIVTVKDVLKRLFIVPLAGVLLVGCAANGDLATGKVTAAEKSIAVAREGHLAGYTTPELTVAQDKLTEAKVALLNENYKEAQRLADEASADADYARTKASTERTKSMVSKVQEDIDMLRREIQSSP